MKKAIVLLLALAVLGGTVFAQATVNGYVRTVTTFTDGSVAYADRIRLNLGYTSEDEVVKMFARLQGDSTAAPTPQYAWGSVKLFDGMAKITAGYLGNWDYEFGTGISNYKLGNVSNDADYIDQIKGVMVEAFPIDGLSFAGVYTPDGSLTIGDLYFATKYALEGTGTAIIDADLDSNDAMRIGAAFQFTGVENLSATAGYEYIKDDMSVLGIIDYAMGDLSLEVAPQYFLDASSLYIEGYVSYKMGNAQFNLVGAYDQDSLNLKTKAKAATYKLDTATGLSVIDKAAVAATASTYLFGIEAIYNIGKAQLEADFYYDEVAEWSIPLTVKVSF
jgi:hypothetical protein